MFLYYLFTQPNRDSDDYALGKMHKKYYKLLLTELFMENREVKIGHTFLLGCLVRLADFIKSLIMT